MQGLKRESRRMGFRPHSVWSMANSQTDESKCRECGQYTEVDCFGFCLDDDCRRIRFIRALHNGEATRLTDGTILWTPGKKIRIE